jgi:transcriptional regulator with XRE-family HTH domain
MFDKAVLDQSSDSEAAYAAPQVMSVLAIFGANFKRLREALGLSRDQTAERLGLAEEHLAAIEAGAKDQVDFELIVVMTKQLPISYDDLFPSID